jgi:hypothetical protein
MAMNNHQPSLHVANIPYLFDGQGKTAICRSFEDQLLHHMDVKTKS